MRIEVNETNRINEIISKINNLEEEDYKEFFNFFLLRNNKIDGFVVGDHVFYKEHYTSISKKLKYHELTHVIQFKENGILNFLAKYSYEYFYNIFVGKMSKNQAYRNISFEKEAFLVEEYINKQ